MPPFLDSPPASQIYDIIESPDQPIAGDELAQDSLVEQQLVFKFTISTALDDNNEMQSMDITSSLGSIKVIYSTSGSPSVSSEKGKFTYDASSTVL